MISFQTYLKKPTMHNSIEMNINAFNLNRIFIMGKEIFNVTSYSSEDFLLKPNQNGYWKTQKNPKKNLNDEDC